MVLDNLRRRARRRARGSCIQLITSIRLLKTPLMTRVSAKNKTPKISISALTHPAATVKALKDAGQAHVKKYKTVKNTVSSYSGQLSRGQKFLRDVVAKRRENGEEVCAEGIKTDELEKAFEKPPNQYSALALELFLVHKCFNENLGKSTADSIHGAFAGLWDNMCVSTRESELERS
jgi:hypothetical protein